MSVALECGWGRLVFGQTFADHQEVLAVLAQEVSGRRDICMYIAEPQVLVSLAPFELFIDPSVTYRLRLDGERPAVAGGAVRIRGLHGAADADEVNRLYAACGMLAAPVARLVENASSEVFHYLLAEETDTGRIVGTVTGIDHAAAFGDPERGSSLWCLAVDSQCGRPGIGEALVLRLAEDLAAVGAAFVDLSVIHDNTPAIRLYEKLGFVREPVFCVKRKNPINERLFAASPAEDLAHLNPYARIVADEAIRRGIHVEVLDPSWGELRLTHGGRKIVTRESLSELTTAVAMSRCDDKRVTRRMLAQAGLNVPRGRSADGGADDAEFLAETGSVVVKPARGEQGKGITVGVSEPDALRRAVELARTYCAEVLLEEFVAGEDLRVLLIDRQVVAAAVRRPAAVIGTVRARKPNGRLRVVPIGTHSARFSEGARVTIFTDDPAVSYSGTVLPLKASGHAYNDEVDSQGVGWEHVEVRVDEPASTAEDLAALGIELGDFVAHHALPEITPGGFVKSRHLDDKAGVAAALAAFKAINEAGVELPITSHLLITIAEEVGHGASHGLHESRETGLTVAMQDMTGPFDYHLTRKLLALCREHGIEHRRDVFDHYRSDVAAAIEAGAEMRAALIGFGTDATHGHERTTLSAIRSVVELTTLYLQSELTFQDWDAQPLGDLADFPHEDQPAPVQKTVAGPDGGTPSGPAGNRF